MRAAISKVLVVMMTLCARTLLLFTLNLFQGRSPSNRMDMESSAGAMTFAADKLGVNMAHQISQGMACVRENMMLIFNFGRKSVAIPKNAEPINPITSGILYGAILTSAY